MEYLLLILLLSMAFSAFFSGLEIAFYQANHLKVELQSKQGLTSAKLLSRFTSHPTNFITNTLIGNNIALVVYGLAFTRLFDLLFPQGIFGLQDPFISFILLTIISTVIILIFSEFLPKALFLINPNKVLNLFMLPYSLTYIVFYPINILVRYVSKWLLLIPGIKVRDKKPTFDFYDIFHSYDSEESSEEETPNFELDRQMVKNVIELPNVKVRECMVPRTELVAVEAGEEIETLRKMFVETGLSKILVYQENIDQVIGFIHMIDLYTHPDDIKKILRPIVIVAESMPANKLLKQFTDSNRSLGLVVDEYGGTSGLVTIEDLLEEIFGEIEDEFDKEEFREVKVKDNEYIFSARLEIDYLNEKYGFELPEADYETLGGFILEIHESIPKINTIIHFEHLTFKVLSATENRIEEVLMKINKL